MCIYRWSVLEKCSAGFTLHYETKQCGNYALCSFRTKKKAEIIAYVLPHTLILIAAHRFAYEATNREITNKVLGVVIKH